MFIKVFFKFYFSIPLAAQAEKYVVEFFGYKAAIAAAEYGEEVGWFT